MKMVEFFFEVLLDWAIGNKIFSITLDNASANNSMVDIMKTQFNLQNS